MSTTNQIRKNGSDTKARKQGETASAKTRNGADGRREITIKLSDREYAELKRLEREENTGDQAGLRLQGLAALAIQEWLLRQMEKPLAARTIRVMPTYSPPQPFPMLVRQFGDLLDDLLIVKDKAACLLTTLGDRIGTESQKEKPVLNQMEDSGLCSFSYETALKLGAVVREVEAFGRKLEASVVCFGAPTTAGKAAAA